MAAAKTARDRIREKTIGSNSTRKSKVIDLSGEKILIKAPSISVQEAIFEAAGGEMAPGPDGNQIMRFKHPMRFAVSNIIACSFEPETNQPIFSEMDRPALMEEALDGWLKDLAGEISSFMAKAPEDASKNSAATSDAKAAS